MTEVRLLVRLKQQLYLYRYLLHLFHATRLDDLYFLKKSESTPEKISEDVPGYCNLLLQHLLSFRKSGPLSADCEAIS